MFVSKSRNAKLVRFVICGGISPANSLPPKYMASIFIESQPIEKGKRSVRRLDNNVIVCRLEQLVREVIMGKFVVLPLTI